MVCWRNFSQQGIHRGSKISFKKLNRNWIMGFKLITRKSKTLKKNVLKKLRNLKINMSITLILICFWMIKELKTLLIKLIQRKRMLKRRISECLKSLQKRNSMIFNLQRLNYKKNRIYGLMQKEINNLLKFWKKDRKFSIWHLTKIRQLICKQLKLSCRNSIVRLASWCSILKL